MHHQRCESQPGELPASHKRSPGARTDRASRVPRIQYFASTCKFIDVRGRCGWMSREAQIAVAQIICTLCVDIIIFAAAGPLTTIKTQKKQHSNIYQQRASQCWVCPERDGLLHIPPKATMAAFSLFNSILFSASYLPHPRGDFLTLQLLGLDVRTFGSYTRGAIWVGLWPGCATCIFNLV